MKSRLLLVILALAPGIAHAQADAWWHHVTVLAHDSMRGRETGSHEHKLAAQYIADQFKRAGLAPAGTLGFLQPVAFTKRTLDESRSSLVLVSNGKEKPLVLGQDASFVLRAPLGTQVDAPVVFAGYGLSLPEYKHDDLAGLDLRGAIVAYVLPLPKGIPGPVVSHSRAQAWEVFRARGAIGMLTFAGGDADTLFTRAQRNRLAPAMALADRALDSYDGNQLYLSFNAARAEQLFAGAPATFDTISALAAKGLPLPHFALHVRLRAKAVTTNVPVSSENVAGVLRGSDPRLRDEYVVLTAHLDHVGVGPAVKGDSIYNGAMDNASGIALLIETARALVPKQAQLKRSILFVAVTAEEKGLLGSRYYANHPTVPAASIVANLNTDMFLPLMPLRSLIVNGLEESNLADDVQRAGASMGVAVVSDPEPEENRFIRSDQYSFILRGVPALSLKVGFARGSPENEIVKKFRAERYHQPSDDLNQPVDRQAAADFSKLYLQLVEGVANRPVKPAWNADSFFKRFAK